MSKYPPKRPWDGKVPSWSDNLLHSSVSLTRILIAMLKIQQSTKTSHADHDMLHQLKVNKRSTRAVFRWVWYFFFHSAMVWFDCIISIWCDIDRFHCFHKHSLQIKFPIQIYLSSFLGKREKKVWFACFPTTHMYTHVSCFYTPFFFAFSLPDCCFLVWLE